MADVLKEVKSELFNKIQLRETSSIENDDEYYFAVGQVVNYLLSKNRSRKKVHSLANPFITAKKDERLKELIRQLYKKYNYDIELAGIRFNNLYSMILSYYPESKVNEDMIIAGYLSNNLIYFKEEKGGN